jgi:uncharacterized protein YwlG (UPF0340 family)
MKEIKLSKGRLSIRDIADEIQIKRSQFCVLKCSESEYLGKLKKKIAHDKYYEFMPVTLLIKFHVKQTSSIIDYFK